MMLDSRGGRVLEEGRRSLVDAGEWAWIEDRNATITFEKAVLDASNVPALEKLYERRLA